MSNFYDILGVEKTATMDDIKKAYKDLALKHHPDRNNGEKESEEKFKEISEAYTVLSNTDKRREYDEGPRRPQGFGGFPFDMGDIFGGGRNSRNAPRRGSDILLSVKISLYEAIIGVTKKINYSFETKCIKCVSKCNVCDGTGAVGRGNNFFNIAQVCHICRGTGEMFTPIIGCESCGGKGTIKEDREGSLNIPAGIFNGAKLGVGGGGFTGNNGGPSGNLIVQIEYDIPNGDSFTEEQKEKLKEIFGESN